MAYRTITITLATGQTITKRIDERGIVPAGGTTGQKLGKLTGDDFDVGWMDDSGSELTPDQINAITGADAPSASNVFATMADLSDAIMTINVDNGLTNNAGVIELGGQLTKNTKVKHGASILQIGNDSNNVQLGSVPNDFYEVSGISSLDWRGIAIDSNDLTYAIMQGVNGDIYRRYSLSGDFIGMGLTDATRGFTAIGVAPNLDVYIGAYFNDGTRKIYQLVGGSAPLVDTSASNDYNYLGICVAPNGDVYAAGSHKTTSAGAIFKRTGGTGAWNDLSETNRKWTGMAADANGNIYATVSSGSDTGVYKQTAGSGSFAKIGTMTDYIYGITVANNGDIYVCSPGSSGIMYRRIDATGEWVETTCTPNPGYDLATASTDEIFMTASYKLYKKLADACGLQYAADYSALNVDNPRWIPDQGRVAVMITEAGTGLTGDEIDAIHGANAPSVYNPFATMDDIGGSQLTADELAAVQGANAPSAANVFATMNDIPPDELTGDQLDAIQGANNPSVYNVFATMDDLPAVTTINNNANNRLITGSDTANTLEGESTLTYDGTTFVQTGTVYRNVFSSGYPGIYGEFDHDGNTNGLKILAQTDSGANIDSGRITFWTAVDGVAATKKMTLMANGELEIDSLADAGGDHFIVADSGGGLKNGSIASSETVSGVIELATQAEVDAGTDAVRAVTPATLKGSANVPVVSNNANNRVITGGSGQALNGEANLTFDGSTLALTGDQTVSSMMTSKGLTLTYTLFTSTGQTIANDCAYTVMAVGSASTVYLPTSPANGEVHIVSNRSTTQSVTVDGNGNNIYDNGATYTTRPLTNRQSWMFMWNGSAWSTIAFR